jgi:hypothetical protein
MLSAKCERYVVDDSRRIPQSDESWYVMEVRTMTQSIRAKRRKALPAACLAVCCVMGIPKRRAAKTSREGIRELQLLSLTGD